MSFLHWLFEILDAEISSAPTSYGVFHIISLVAVVALTVFLCIKFGKTDTKTLRIIAATAWILILVLEIYKQTVYTFEYEDRGFSVDYQWYAFPYQFCSSPLYVLPFIAFLPDGKVRDCFLGFMGTFSLFAGLAVMIYPNDVFIRTIGVNIQTMVHHGLQVVLGIFFTVHFFRTREKSERKLFHFGAVAVFSVMVIIAMLLNVVVHNALVSAGNDETFNMFYISPYHDCTLPVLSVVDDFIPYPLFLVVYIIGFAIAASVVYYVTLGIYNLSKRLKKESFS